MRTAMIRKTTRTPKRSWLSIQEQCGLDPRTARECFSLTYDPVDEDVWRLECRDHRVSFEPIALQ